MTTPMTAIGGFTSPLPVNGVAADPPGRRAPAPARVDSGAGWAWPQTSAFNPH